MIDLQAYKLAFQHMPSKICEAEVNAEIHDTVVVYVDEKKRNGVEISKKSALYVRASGEKTGYYYTENMQEDAMHAIEIAYENSLYSENAQYENMNQEPTRLDFGEEKAEQNVNKLSFLAIDLLKKVKSYIEFPKEKITVWGSLKAETFGQQVVNSRGFEMNCIKPLYILEIGACVEEEGKVYGSGASLAAGDIKHFDLKQAAKDMSMKCRVQMKPGKSFESREYPVILGNSVVYYLFATGWQFFSGAKYLSKSSAFSGLLGEKISGMCLEIIDKSLGDGSGFSILADCEGSKGTSTSIIKEGIWYGLLHNRMSASQMGQELTGNAGRRPLLSGTICTDILVTPKNFCIEPGNASLEEMKEHMGNGILITESFDVFHTLDIGTGNFSIPCYGIRIENGKEMEGFTGMTMTGNFRELLENIVEVGSEKILHPMIALDNYGIGSCPIRLSSLYLSGE